jgi:mRNA-degrading endonuclease toxin of MazEF toxin-antitoxin module
LKPGQIVKVNWRDAFPNSGEPNKARPGIVVGSPRFFEALPFKLVVPLSGSEDMALEDASIRIEPTSENGCTKPSYALSWNIQCVPHLRLEETPSHITDDELRRICDQVAACINGV